MNVRYMNNVHVNGDNMKKSNAEALSVVFQLESEDIPAGLGSAMMD